MQVLKRGPVNIETNRNQFCKDCTIVGQRFLEPDAIQYSTPLDIVLLFVNVKVHEVINLNFHVNHYREETLKEDISVV